MLHCILCCVNHTAGLGTARRGQAGLGAARHGGTGGFGRLFQSAVIKIGLTSAP